VDDPNPGAFARGQSTDRSTGAGRSCGEFAAAASPPARQRIALPRWGWAFSALAAVLVCILLAVSTIVTASAQALPGSGLYPVKLATEDAWLRLTPERQEPRLHLRFRATPHG